MLQAPQGRGLCCCCCVCCCVQLPRAAWGWARPRPNARKAIGIKAARENPTRCEQKGVVWLAGAQRPRCMGRSRGLGTLGTLGKLGTVPWNASSRRAVCWHRLTRLDLLGTCTLDGGCTWAWRGAWNANARGMPATRGKRTAAVVNRRMVNKEGVGAARY